jgi:hypothetical protein
VDPFFAQILSGMQATLSAQSIALHLLVVEDADAEIDTYRRWTSERRVDGVVMVDVWARDPRRAVLKQLRVPSVVLGGPGPRPVQRLGRRSRGDVVHSGLSRRPRPSADRALLSGPRRASAIIYDSDLMAVGWTTPLSSPGPCGRHGPSVPLETGWRPAPRGPS